jgi:predicted Zn finger-like uncharacterized protein
MSTIVCPACDSSIEVDEDALTLANRFRCEECEALLEVANEDPLEIEWVLEEADDESEED